MYIIKDIMSKIACMKNKNKDTSFEIWIKKKTSRESVVSMVK